MNQNNNRNYYTDIKKKMMKDFDKILKFTRQIQGKVGGEDRN
jgi:hypothetical protein